MATTNYLIGRGELLTEPLGAPRITPTKAHPYTLDEARARLLPQIAEVLQEIAALPDSETPGQVATARFTLHPSYLAKSYFPSRFLRLADLEVVGSKYVEVEPEVRTVKRDGPLAASDLFLAGTRSAFAALPQVIANLADDSVEAAQFAEFERVSSIEPADKVKVSSRDSARVPLEIGIHVPDSSLIENPRQAFVEYASSLGFECTTDLAFEARGLWFVPAIGGRDQADRLAAFSLVRVVRDMPTLRNLPAPTQLRALTQPIKLPSGGAINPALRVAILDGGLSSSGPLSPWINGQVNMEPDAEDHLPFVSHGTAVTSAFLFGPLVPGGVVPRPFAEVDHYRILDASTGAEDPFELYRTLGHIEEVLLTRFYEFVNLSLGPDLPIEDDEVHAWTAVIDELLSDGQTLMTVAVGNNGHLDRASGNARVQVPSDSVNALSVGASSGTDVSWSRAFYSAVGPGRRPGAIKPDVIAHGGDQTDYFHVVSAGSALSVEPQMGTSFSAPLALRSGAAIRSIMGDDISVLAIKALLVNAAQRSETDDAAEVGWGKLPDDISTIITCPDGVARVIYQGELKPGKFLRAPVPLPADPLTGRVSLKATFCFASSVDPQSPDAYTRSGLQITFRPDLGRLAKGSTQPKTRSFFTQAEYASEDNLRSDLGKWETVLHGSDRMLGSTLVNPVFDIHYVAREESASTKRDAPMRYALVLTLEAPRHADLFGSILSAHAGVLSHIEPQVVIPLGV